MRLPILLFPFLFPALALASSVDLRQKASDYEKQLWQKQWTFEDQWIQAQRLLADTLRKQARDEATQSSDSLAKADDWKKARDEQRAKRRSFEAESRQRAKVRREQLELELLKFVQERQTEAKAFIAGLESDLASFKKDPSYRKAEADLRELESELSSGLQSWREKMKSFESRDPYTDQMY